ncbi:TP901 family phage tail tape measure protein [Microbacterium sp. AG1240]|uniref:phage tail tape measure protein n=1 Tax=Microbacterium sp. AG1240 TaxID=2183992 RepID=UPI000F130D9C|nr:phage tail tape measure protein [Microbacterium sp. AG1240]RKT33678.1 TP901 family phage tail tape measure protein [Microbacterium sp. AG1240]
MAERVVKVRLSAQVAEYTKGMQEAAEATRGVGSQGEKLAQTKKAMETLGRSGVVAGGLLAAGIGVAINAYAQFDQAMSYVIATGQDAADSQDALREAALEAGASTVFSATESANAIEELAKAGISASDILGGGLAGALDLAAAGGLGVAEAAGIAATTMQQFQLKGEDASHVADLLAAGAGKAMGDVTDMGAALNQAGLVASQFGLSVDETVGTLSAFASAGMLGSDAGTSMRTMLLRLANPTEEVKTLMASLGLEAYDASGQFIGLSGLAGELSSSLAGMTQQQKDTTLAMIFGQDAIRGANILLREGESGIKDWTSAVDDQGYAAETAAKRLDNLMGDWEAFTGALETAFIQMGAGADGPLRALVQGLTGLVEGFTELPEWVQQGTLVLGGVLAAIGLVGGGALLAIPKIVEFRIAMQTLGLTSASTKGALSSAAAFMGGPWGIAIGVAVAAAAVWISTNQRMASAAAELRDTLDESTGVLTDYSRELIAKKLQEGGAYDAVRDLGISQKELTDAVFEGGSAYEDLMERMRGAHDESLGFNSTLGNAINTVRELGVNIEDAKAGHENLAAATADSTEAAEGSMGAAEGQQEALGSLALAAGDAQQQVSDLADSIRNFGSAQFDVEQATISFHDAVAGLDEALQGGSASLDVTTEAGRNTLGAMLDVAKSTNDYAASVSFMGGSTEAVQGILDAGRQKIINTRIALGDSEQAARNYANQLVATPEAISTQVNLNGADEAQRRVEAFQASLNRIAPQKTVTLNMIQQYGPLKPSAFPDSANGNLFDYQRGMTEAFANGGFATGIYAGRPGGRQKFAEPETIWEAYISGKPDQRDRNIGIAYDALNRLGASPQGQVSFPDRITLVDENGSILTQARVIASSAVAADTASRRRGFGQGVSRG